MISFIGIDNGIKGGIVVLDENGNLAALHPMPTESDGKKQRVDAIQVGHLLSEHEQASVAFERPCGSKSVLAAVSMQDSFAKIETVLRLRAMRHTLVTPKAWQKTFWSVPKMPKGQSFDTKAAALRVAKQLWPAESWLASPRCKKPHDGLVDAALIAEYARRAML